MTELDSLHPDIANYIAGDDASGDLICATLEPPIRTAVRGFLPPGDADADDIVQESLIAMLTYLRRSGVAPDNPAAFVVTIARNRCLNLHVWRRRRSAQDVDDVAERLPSIAASPLDLVASQQRRTLLSEALGSLDEGCRDLLESVYIRETTIEELRRALGLKSVQAVYHRRNICIKKAQMFLNRRLFACRSVESNRVQRESGQHPAKECDDE